MKDTLFSSKITLNLGGKLITLDQPWVMGILNITPDSFYQGSRFQQEKEILTYAESMLRDGADIIDIGGYSTRPGATEISEEEELKRILPAINSLLKSFPEAILSIDTFRSQVARQAVDSGVLMVNDVTGGEFDHHMFDTMAALKVPYVLMHMKGDSRTMKSLVHYNNLFKEITSYFNARINLLKDKGVTDIIIDPGFGFAKTLDQNYELLKNLTYFELLGCPLLVGLSRKSMVYKKLEIESSNALNGSTVVHTVALLKRASILRVHDVKEAKQIIKLLTLL